MIKILREIAGYVLGLVVFVGLMPTLMWLASGRPSIVAVAPVWLIVVGLAMMVLGLALSLWSIIHMRHVGKGNPFDAFGHEVAPRTQHLMTDGPYRFSRNPMLLGVFVLLIGMIVILHTWQAVLIFALFVAIMLRQVASEEKRLAKDFGDEYAEYCKHTRRII
jgi:protein-S-isoprenylcysteine O-methyltransferase Ste14